MRPNSILIACRIGCHRTNRHQQLGGQFHDGDDHQFHADHNYVDHVDHYASYDSLSFQIVSCVFPGSFLLAHYVEHMI